MAEKFLAVSVTDHNALIPPEVLMLVAAAPVICLTSKVSVPSSNRTSDNQFTALGQDDIVNLNSILCSRPVSRCVTVTILDGRCATADGELESSVLDPLLPAISSAVPADFFAPVTSGDQ